MAPSLAYGRHRGPSRPHSRVAAVAIALFRDRNDNWTVPLTLRPLTLKHHGGQICLPGGQVEPGEAIGAAAMREFEEELGRRPEILGHVGELSTQYVYASDNVVHPVVFEIQAPDGPWHPDPVEVAEVIQLPLRALGRSGDRVESICSRPVLREDEEKGRFRFRMSAWRYRGHEIWGATALILEELAQLLHPIE